MGGTYEWDRCHVHTSTLVDYAFMGCPQQGISVPDEPRVPVRPGVGDGLSDLFACAGGDSVGGPPSCRCVDDVIGRDFALVAEIVRDGDSCVRQEAEARRLAMPGFLRVSEGLTVHFGEADLGMNLVDAIVLGGAGIDLEDLLAERVGLGRDTVAETLFGQSVGFGI